MESNARQHKLLCKQFRFGGTGSATFSGPVVLLPEGLFLAATSVTTASGHTAAALFGLLGSLIASAFSSLSKIEFPYPAVPPEALPENVRTLMGFGRLQPKHRVVVVRREQIRGYTTSFLTGFKLVCHGEDIYLMGSRRKIIAMLAEFGYAEYQPELQEKPSR